MNRKDVLTRLLAVVGTVLVWTPILFAVLTSVAGTISRRMFRFDYLMPAELFPVASLVRYCSCGRLCGRAPISNSLAGVWVAQ